MNRGISPSRRPSTPTYRQIEVLELRSRGLSKKRVGQELDISPKTVRRHVQEAAIKLGVSEGEAVARWRELIWATAEPPLDPLLSPANTCDVPVRRLAANWRTGWKEIEVKWNVEKPYIPEWVVETLPRLVEELRQEHASLGQPFYNSTLARFDAVHRSDEEDSSISLSLGTVDYFTYHALSQNLDRRLNRENTIREAYQRDFYSSRKTFPSGLGVGLVMVSKDHKVLVGRRSPIVHTYAGCYGVSSAGFVIVRDATERAGEDAGIETDLSEVLFSSERREAKEEAVVQILPGDVIFYLLTANPRHGDADLFGLVYLQPTNTCGRDLDGDELANLLSPSAEIEAYEALPFTVEAFSDHLARKRWVPENALAMIVALMYELHRQDQPNAERTVINQMKKAVVSSYNSALARWEQVPMGVGHRLS